MSFGNKQKNQNTIQSLTNALTNRDKRPINIGNVAVPQGSVSNNDNVWGGAKDAMAGAFNLGKGLYNSGLLSNGADSGSTGIFSSAANNFITETPDYGIFGNAINGTAGSGSAIGDAIATETSGSALGNVAPYGGLIMGGLRAGMNGLNGGDWKDDVPQSFFGINPEGSDVSQTISGAAQGALMGLPFGGPIGAAIGGILGAGASFLDDI